MTVPWRFLSPSRIESYTAPPGSPYVLLAGDGGSLTLLGAQGKPRWTFQLPSPIETVSSDGSPEIFAAGTWDGQIRVYLPEGFSFSHQLPGVVSAVAVSTQAGRLAAGSWSGHLHIHGLDGTLLREHLLAEAILHAALHASGQPVIAALAGGQIVAVDSGGERWSFSCNSEVLHLEAFGHEILAVTASSLTWLDYEGRVARQHALSTRLTHFAVSAGGSWAAWVEESRLLHFFSPDSGTSWSIPLPEPPDALTLAGDGANPVLMVALPSSKLWAFNRWQVRGEEALPGRVSSLSPSRWGTEALALSLEREAVLFMEFPAIKKWLPPPQLDVRVQAGHLAAQQAGTLALDVTNDGARAARKIEIAVRSEFLRLSRSASLEEIGPGETRRVRVAVEPVKAGELLLDISVKYQDEADEEFTKTFEAVVKVVQG